MFDEACSGARVPTTVVLEAVDTGIGVNIRWTRAQTIAAVTPNAAACADNKKVVGQSDANAIHAATTIAITTGL
jgi:hypothetical protein